jgi:holliday junction DNA helicase RuvA
MIASIQGKLVQINDGDAMVQVGAVGYEIMLPGYCVAALANKIGEDIELCTMEYYEGTPGGGNLIPRMVGFLNAEERNFFRKFTSVKGIGIKKGLKSLSIPIETIASAIENNDEKIIMSLPGLGKRMAQQIIAELKGKVQAFASGQHPAAEERSFKAHQAEALEILIAWGEKRNESMELIALACKKHPDVKTAEELVPLVYRLKQGIEV